MLNTDQIQAPTTNTFGLMATPAVDLTPTGHLPYLVAQADTTPIRAEAEQILAQCCQRRPDRDPATGYLLSGVEHTDETSLDRLLCVEDHGHDGDHRDAMRRTWPRAVQTAEQPRHRAEQIDRLAAALPDAVDQSMRKALPDKYTPALADAIATGMVAELRQGRQDDEPATEPDSVATPAAGIVAQLKANADAANKAGLGSPALDAFNAKVIRLVSASPDPEATIGELAQLLHREPVRTTNCRLFPAWCVEAGPHYDHFSADVKVIDTEGEDVVDARILYLSDSSPIVCIGQSDFTADQARMKAAELRGFADRIDELSGHVDKAHTPRA